jgi:hypothetical protein
MTDMKKVRVVCIGCGHVFDYDDLVSSFRDFIMANDVFDKHCGAQVIVVDVEEGKNGRNDNGEAFSIVRQSERDNIVNAGGTFFEIGLLIELKMTSIAGKSQWAREVVVSQADLAKCCKCGVAKVKRGLDLLCKAGSLREIGQDSLGRRKYLLIWTKEQTAK